MNTKERTGILILRLGLGGFLLLWSIDKLMEPGKTIQVFEKFYLVLIGSTAASLLDSWVCSKRR